MKKQMFTNNAHAANNDQLELQLLPEDNVNPAKYKCRALKKLFYLIGSLTLLCLVVTQIYLYAICRQLKAEAMKTAHLIQQYQDLISDYDNYEVIEDNNYILDSTTLSDVYNNEESYDSNIKWSVFDYIQYDSSENDSFINQNRTESHMMVAGFLNKNGTRTRQKRSHEAEDKRKNRERGNNRNNNRKHEVAEKHSHHQVLHLQLEASRLDPQILQGEKITGWTPRDVEFNREQTFGEFSQDQVMIKKAGLYLIYSQITFLDIRGRWSYSITIQESYRQEKPFIKCLNTEWGIEHGPDGEQPTTFSQCYSAAVAYISEGEIVRMRSLYNIDSIHTDLDMSFWGFVKLS